MSEPDTRLPYAHLDALLLDLGNTIVSLDFDRLALALLGLGLEATPHALERAEARARPVFSRALGSELHTTEGHEVFAFYLRAVLDGLAGFRALAGPARAALAGELASQVRSEGASDRLWSRVLPGVPEALASFREQGLRLIVVSNADGSAERNVQARGLGGWFDAVLDSGLLGFEKPDPRIFERALEITGVEAARAAHVGDLYAVDVVGARAAGVHAVLLDPFGDWPDADCARFPDLGALAARLREERTSA